VADAELDGLVADVGQHIDHLLVGGLSLIEVEEEANGIHSALLYTLLASGLRPAVGRLPGPPHLAAFLSN